MRKAEAWLAAGDEESFVQSMVQLMESQTAIAADTQEALV